MDLSISIVSYNTKDFLRRCLRSIYQYTQGINFEVFVVDNASQDGSAQMVKNEFPQVNLIVNSQNLFFTKAHNQALKKARSRYFLILNSDTYFVDNSLSKMVKFMDENPKVGACQGKEVKDDGTIVKTGKMATSPLADFYLLSWWGRKIANKKLVGRILYEDWDRETDREIDVGCDAFLMVRKKILDKIGGYDERFLLYYTEDDLCARIKREGFKIEHFAGTQVRHNIGASTAVIGEKKIGDIYLADFLHYYQKYHHFWSGLLLFLDLKIERYILSFLKRW